MSSYVAAMDLTDDQSTTSSMPPTGHMLQAERTSNSSATTTSAVSHVSSTSSSGGRPNLHSFASQDGRKTICDGRFIVLETLGTGATGKVKLGIDTGSGERVALKIMGKVSPEGFPWSPCSDLPYQLFENTNAFPLPLAPLEPPPIGSEPTGDYGHDLLEPPQRSPPPPPSPPS